MCINIIYYIYIPLYHHVCSLKMPKLNRILVLLFSQEVATIPSKRLRNKIAGFTTHLMKRDLATDEAHRWGLKTHTWPFEWGKYGKMQCIFLASIFLGAPISRQSYVGRSYKYVGFVGMLTAFRCDSHFCERIPLHKWMLAPHSLSWCPPTSWSSFCSFQSVLFQFSC